MSVLRGLEGMGWWPALVIWAMASDTLLHMGLASMFAAGEAKVRWLYAVTIPLATLLLAFAVLNAGYLSEAGEQLTARRVADALDRFADFERAAADFLRRVGWFKIGFLGVLLVAAPLGLRWLLVRKRGPWKPLEHGHQRAISAAWIAVGALLVAMVWPDPSAIPAKQLGPSAAIHSYWDWLVGTDDPSTQYAEGVDFQGYQPASLIPLDDIRRWGSLRNRPNVVIVIGESTRYDYTSISGPDSRAKTPHLAALAARGTVVRTTRAALPHTTKSVFSMMCGRLPLMQRVTVEVSEALQIQCLPEILTTAGYDTAFMQSALGTFEQRPRLVDKLGYSHFEAWEEIGGQPLGYLASDDESLGPAFERWLKGRADSSKPFFATLLTSAAHHPYELSSAIKTRAAKSGAPTGSDAERYARLIEGQDALLGAVVATLEAAGKAGNTVIVFVGDHGEGFGAYGVRQHDSNYYDEGLRVPWVMAGPGVPRGEIKGNASLVDVMPSLLHPLGLPAKAKGFEGINVFAGVPELPRWFGCWFEMSCRGFVLGKHKVVHIPQSSRLFSFDLDRDPLERTARSLPEELEKLVPQMHSVIESHRTRTFPLIAGELRRKYGEWSCPANRPCTHPKSPKGVFFDKK